MYTEFVYFNPIFVIFSLNLGMSGIGLTHFDIGGYTTMVRHGTTENVAVQLNMVRTEELFLRGAEMAMFTPVMRTHEGQGHP